MNEKLVWLKDLIDRFCEEFLVYTDPTYTYEAQAPIYQFWEWVQKENAIDKAIEHLTTSTRTVKEVVMIK